MKKERKTFQESAVSDYLGLERLQALSQWHHYSLINMVRRWLGSWQQAQTGSPRLADENLYKAVCRMPGTPTAGSGTWSTPGASCACQLKMVELYHFGII